MEELVKVVKACKQTDQAVDLLFKYIRKTPAIERAVAFTVEKHQGQFRRSGEPYVVHPILVCVFVAYLGGDERQWLLQVFYTMLLKIQAAQRKKLKLFLAKK